jgi:hypothetical protein
MTAQLRLSPSGPVLGGIALMPLRTAQTDAAVAEADFVLDGTEQEFNPALRATLSGPFSTSRPLSAEAQVDITNQSNDTLAAVTLEIQASADGGAGWNGVHLETHNIGANVPGEGGENRVIQQLSIHVPPTALIAWSSLLEDTPSLLVRVVASVVGEAGDVLVEQDLISWIRITEHSAPSTFGQVLRLPPSGPPIDGGGPLEKMPLRVVEIVDAPEVAVSLTGVLAEPFSALRVALPLPAASQYVSLEGEIDVSNAMPSEDPDLAVVTVAVRVRADAGAWTTIQDTVHNVGANDDGQLRQIRRCSVHVPPVLVSDFAAPGGTAQLEFSVWASVTGVEADAVKLEASECFLRVVEHTSDPSAVNALRLSPSGPVLGELGLAVLRVEEDQIVGLAAPLVLDGDLTDIDATLRASLTGPFDLSHYWAAQLDLDASNASSTEAAQCTFAIEVQLNGAGAWTEVHSEQHAIGGNGADGLRQIRPVRLHMPPADAAAWGILAGTTSIAIRATALMSSGEPGEAQIEATQCWLRLTEHNAP